MSEAILRRLGRLHPRAIDMSLARVERLLGACGSPECRLPPVTIFAGTNGKGSTLAMVRAGLEASGASVHAYTSPHLVRFAERIVVGGREIDESALTDLLAEVEAINAAEPITFFEATTCAALLAFSRAGADHTLVEVGMGGGMDATNPRGLAPRLCVITPIGLDHVDFLGDTVEEIAEHKGGILRPNVPAIVAPQVYTRLGPTSHRMAIPCCSTF